MSNTNTLFADNTQRILDEGIECGNDFASLAISGETLRGYAALNDLNPPELAAYDAFLRSYKGEAHDDLEMMMAETMVELYAYAGESRITREWEDGTALLEDISSILAVGAALTRAGRCEVSRLKALSDRTRKAVRAIAHKLCDLMQYAEDHELIYMGDGEWYTEGLHEVYSFWEVLACLSPSRIAIQVAVGQHARRQRIIEQAVANYVANGPT